VQLFIAATLSQTKAPEPVSPIYIRLFWVPENILKSGLSGISIMDEELAETGEKVNIYSEDFFCELHSGQIDFRTR
jgi:hypothetical protein